MSNDPVRLIFDDQAKEKILARPYRAYIVLSERISPTMTPHKQALTELVGAGFMAAERKAMEIHYTWTPAGIEHLKAKEAA